MNVLSRILKRLFGYQPQQTLTPSEITDIIRATSKVTGITPVEIKCKRRVKKYIYARHIVMYVARETTALSYPQIGRALNRDHTTVMYAAEKLSRRREFDAKLNRDIETIKRMVAR